MKKICDLILSSPKDFCSSSDAHDCPQYACKNGWMKPTCPMHGYCEIVPDVVWNNFGDDVSKELLSQFESIAELQEYIDAEYRKNAEE